MKFLIGYILIANIWIVMNALADKFYHKQSIPRYFLTLILGMPVYFLYGTVVCIMCYGLDKLKRYGEKNQSLKSRAQELANKTNVNNEELFELQHSALTILFRTKFMSKVVKFNSKICNGLNFIIRSALLY